MPILGIAVSAENEIYVADGTNIRMVDKNGIIHTIIGDYYHKSHWKPVPCGRTVSLSQVSVKTYLKCRCLRSLNC